MLLDRVNWEAAITTLRERSAAYPSARRALAETLSLSALFDGEYVRARSRLIEARQLDPLQPLHLWREALLNLRFGQWTRALDQLQTLSPLLPKMPQPLYLRALTYLRQGDFAKAKNVTGELVDAHPTYAPGKFLQAEVQLHFKFKGIEKNLVSLPKDASWTGAWADLLIKLALAYPTEGRKTVEKFVAQLPAEGQPAKLVQSVLGQGGAVESIDETLPLTAPDSRAEEVALAAFTESLRNKPDALESARRLWDRFPDRPAVRRVYVAMLTRHALMAAGQQKLHEALRAVDVCLRLEPYELIHHQNRAALFTLLRDEEGYHDAWASLDRMHFRRALLGEIDPHSARSMAKPHRMFAQQARLSPQTNFGIFREEVDTEINVRRMEVNQARIDADPEQLRQWLHQRRAELTFEHLALGFDPHRFLLGPSDGRQAKARAEGLAFGSRSLPVLVPDEGERLSKFLSQRWNALAGRVGTSYSASRSQDPEVVALQEAHLETFSDLALLCVEWQPDARRLDMVEELLEFLRAEAPFFDDQVLFDALRGRVEEDGREGAAPQAPFNLKRLGFFVASTLDLPDSDERPRLTPAQRKRVAGRLASSLQLHAAIAIINTHRSVDVALSWVDRARQDDDTSPQVEEVAAQLLLQGEYLDEARAAIARFHKLLGSKRDERASARLEQLQALLDKAQKRDAKSQQRAGAATTRSAASDVSETIRELEKHLDRYPSSIQSYEDLAHALGSEGRITEAVEWAERAIARCLNREAQMRARALHLEMLGLQAVATANAPAVRLYLAGTQTALLEVLEQYPPGAERPVAVDYLLGLCRLAAKNRDGAQSAFASALARCDRQMHRAVLRPLAEDVEIALLERARRSVGEALNEGLFENATHEAASTVAELRQPAAFVIDLARIQLAAALAAVGSNTPPPEVPAIQKQSWSTQFEAARRAPTALKRTRLLVELAKEVHPPAQRDAETMLRKIEAMEEQLALAKLLADSSTLLREGKVDAALQVLDGAGASANDSRVLRQKALLLLRLERFEEAEALVDRLRTVNDATARELVERYPALSFKQKISAIHQRLRTGDTAGATKLIESARAVSEADQVELAYCHAFCLAHQAYAAQKEQQLATALRYLSEALARIEGQLSLAEKLKNDRYLELYKKIDKDHTDLEARV